MENYHYNTLEGIKAYRDHPAVNQSALKSMMDNKKFSGESLTMLLGSYLDAKVTLKDSDNTYIFFDGKRPSETIVGLCQQLKYSLEKVAEFAGYKPLDEYDVYLGEFLADKDFYANLSPKQQADNFIKKASDWWDFLIKSEDKFILTETEKIELDVLGEKVLEFLKKISPNCEVFFQKDFYWDWEGLECKGLADIILETDDSIIEIDLKFTTAKTIESWAYIARDLNYPFQKAFYRRGLSGNKDVGQYWLVASNHFLHLVKVTHEMDKFGLNGYSEISKTLESGGTVVKVNKRQYGVLEALEVYRQGKKEHNVFINEKEANYLFYGEQ